MKKLFFVYNPHSGKGQIRNHMVRILNNLTRAGFLVTAYPTQGARDAYKAVCAAEGQYDQIVCSGGDGTLNEVVSALMTYEGPRPKLGYIPAGTTNDFAESIGIPKDMTEASLVIGKGHSFLCDLGLFDGRIYDYVAAFGLFTDTSYKTPQNMKNVFGHQAYVLAGIKSLQDVRSYHMKVLSREKKLQGRFIYGMVANSLSIGGFKGLTGSDVVLDDGLFEVALVKEPNSMEELHNIITALLWQLDSPMIETFKTEKVAFECTEEVDWTLDGEFGGKHKNVEIEVIPRAIELCVGDRPIPVSATD